MWQRSNEREYTGIKWGTWTRLVGPSLQTRIFFAKHCSNPQNFILNSSGEPKSLQRHQICQAEYYENVDKPALGTSTAFSSDVIPQLSKSQRLNKSGFPQLLFLEMVFQAKSSHHTLIHSPLCFGDVSYSYSRTFAFCTFIQITFVFLSSPRRSDLNLCRLRW